jgi:hypothetical protein
MFITAHLLYFKITMPNLKTKVTLEYKAEVPGMACYKYINVCKLNKLCFML